MNIGSLYASVSPDQRFYDHLPGNLPFLKSPAYSASKAAVVLPQCRAEVDLASIPSVIPNQIGNQDARATDGRTLAKIDPATGRMICQVARSTAADVQLAVELAKRAQPGWAATTVVKRGEILRQIAMLMRERRAEYCRSGVGGNRQVEEGCARGNRRRDRDGLLRRGRGPAVLRPDHDQRGAKQVGHGHSAAAWCGRVDHRGEHADRQRGVEGVSAPCSAEMPP